MLGRVAFWSIAVVVAAALAYVVTVPGALERDAPPDQETVAEPEGTAEEPVAEAPAGEAQTILTDDTDRQVALAPPEPTEPALTAPAPETAPALEPGGAPLASPAMPRLPSPDAPATPPASPQPRQAAIGTLPTAGLPFEPGCGLTLRPVGEDRTVFASGVSLEPIGGPAAIHLDGDLLALTRAGVDGDPLGYNQFPRQLFRNADDTVNVIVEITLEEDTLGESARVTGGTVTVMTADRSTAQIEVSGRAGC